MCKKMSFLFLSIISVLFTIWLGSTYFPIEPDVANSPIVWQEILANGWKCINSWKPTVDNWYFSVYPLNFITYFVLGDYGIVSLKLSTALFSVAIIFLSFGILKIIAGKKYGTIGIVLLTLIPAFGYTYGFVGHPFSHNSTNCYGLLCVLIYMINCSKRSLNITFMCSVLASLVSASDPWFIAAYFIPLAISEAVFLIKNREKSLHFFIILMFLLMSWKGLIQKLMGIPVHHFQLVPFHTMLSNIEIIPLLIGKSVNIFVFDSDISAYLSLCVWFFIIVHMVLSLKKRKNESFYFVVLAILSVAGVIFSFILSYNGASIISARFFVNVTCLFLIICCLGIKSKLNILYMIVAVLFSISSIYSYMSNPSPLHNQHKDIDKFIVFLKKHDLNYGYGPFWGMSNTVNWLSEGSIHITPVFFDKDNGTIDFRSSRVQTMTSWLKKEELEKAPARQFVIVSSASDGERCIAMKSCVDGIKSQLGSPDEILKYENSLIFIYNKRLGV